MTALLLGTRALNLDLHLGKFGFNSRKASLKLRYLLVDIKSDVAHFFFTMLSKYKPS